MQYLQKHLQSRAGQTLRAVELGSGCGIVGIALAEMLPRCSVTLTDLPEVDDIVSRNIKLAQPAPGSTLAFQVLDWDEQPNDDVCRQSIDLILVSDCTYNADSLPSLVRILDILVRKSPDALILVALKRRHDSELVFFDLMQGAAFTITEHDTIALPSPYSDREIIEIYAFGRSKLLSM
jgi:predicted nicotinamide N-methyase